MEHRLEDVIAFSGTVSIAPPDAGFDDVIG